jgi:phage antirepressor YoqD-like protein
MQSIDKNRPWYEEYISYDDSSHCYISYDKAYKELGRFNSKEEAISVLNDHAFYLETGLFPSELCDIGC